MAAPKGNQFWRARSSHGRNPIYSDPQDLQDAIYQYFEWVENNPLIEYKPFHNQGEIVNADVPKMRAMTYSACARFCGLSVQGWSEYRNKEGFSEVIKEAEQAIDEQKFTGAAAGFLQHNLIARDLGLREASSVTVETPEPIVFQMNYGGEDDKD